MAIITLNESEKIREILERYSVLQKINIKAPNREISQILKAIEKGKEQLVTNPLNLNIDILTEIALNLLSNMYILKANMFIYWSEFLELNGMDIVREIGKAINV